MTLRLTTLAKFAAIILAVAVTARADSPDSASPPAPQVAEMQNKVAEFAALPQATLVANAPQPPELPADLKLKLVDYIDCADDELHPYLHDGQSRSEISKTLGGGLRYTGSYAGSYFAYRLRVAEAGKPHLLVLTFPDNADRMTAISLSQPPAAATDAAADAPQAMKMEFGYRTGDLLPVSGRMVSSWVVFYPTSDDPAALLVANWHPRIPAALSQAWVYVIEGDLPPAFGSGTKLHRQAGRYDHLPTTLQTRYGNRPANLLAQMDYLGLDELSMLALDHRQLYYPSTAFGGGSGNIPQVLGALEVRGKKFVAAFDPDCTTGVYTMPDQPHNLCNIGDNNVRKAWAQFIVEDFVKPLKNSKSLTGIMFGTPHATVGTDLESGTSYSQLISLLSSEALKANQSLRVYQGLGPATGNDHYLRKTGSHSIVQKWTSEPKTDMQELLADRAQAYLQDYGLSGHVGIPSTLLFRGCGIDDASYYRFYRSGEPRYWMLDSMARNRPLTQSLLFGNRLNGLSLNHVTQWRLMQLRAGHEFWWDYPEMSPHIPPVGPQVLAPLTLALATEVEPFAIWTAGRGSQTALNDTVQRQWIRVFRRMPYRHMMPVDDAPQYPVSVRSYALDGLNVLLTNQTSVEATVILTLDAPIEQGERLSDGSPVKGQKISLQLPPYAIEGLLLQDGHERHVVSVEQSAPGLSGLMAAKLTEFERAMKAAAEAGAEMEPRFAETLTQARSAIDAEKWQEAENLLDAAIIREPALRARLASARPRAEVQKATGEIKIDGRLDDWPGLQPAADDSPPAPAAAPAAIVLDSHNQLIADAFVANRWTGKQDLSAELHLAWRSEGLYFVLRVQDDRPTDDENEASLLAWSRGGHRSWVVRNDYDGMLFLPRKAGESPNLVTRLDGTSVIHEGFIPAMQLSGEDELDSGLTLGLNLVVSDSDDRRGMPFAWCKSSVLAWSVLQDGYSVFSDAQTCGEITLK